MANLTVLRKPQPVQVTHRPAGPKPSNDPYPGHSTTELVGRLEAALNSEKVSREEVSALVREIKARLAAQERAAGAAESAVPVYNAPHNSQVTIGGDVGEGANTGPGTVNNSGGVAGRDHLTQTVEQGAINLRIEHVDKLSLSAAEAESVSRTPLSEAEAEYLTRLMITASRVPLGQLDLELGGADGRVQEIKLDSIYIPLETTNTQHAIGGQHDERVNIPALRHVIDHRRSVILGDPGSGKSTFLNFLTWCLAGARLHPKRNNLNRLNVEGEDGQRAARWRFGALLPVRIDLREFALDIPPGAQMGSADMLWKHIAHRLHEHHQGDFARDLQTALHEGQALVMLDGLDEVPDKTLRQIVRQAITDFADTHSRSRFIVTCRILSYTDPAWKLTSFPDATLAPLSRSGIAVFVEGWYATLTRLGYMDPRWNKERAGELRHAAVGPLYDLAQNPMLLTVMAVVHTYKGTLPRERARLYSDGVDLLLWNWQRTKQIGPEKWEQGILDELNTREERVMNALCDAAFQAHRAQGAWPDAASIPQKELLNTLKSYLDNDWGKAQKFCEYVEKRAGLLVGRGERAGEFYYAFPHRGFQEFLAGRYLVNGRDFARHAAALAAEGDIWHEVLLLAAGHLVFNLQDVHRPLDAANLLCRDELPATLAGWRAVWWAAEILLIVGRAVAQQDQYVGQALVPRVIAHLTALLQGDWLAAAERAQAGDALGCLGDPRPGVCTLLPDMARVEGGTFSLGEDGERHPVRLKPFYLACYPLTNAQFRQFTESEYMDKSYWTPQGLDWRAKAGQRRGLVNDPVWGIDNRPAVGLTWHEAVAYVAWLAAKTGKPYRLPTEAEWERAAAGKEGRKYPWGSRASDDTANTREAGIGQTTAVGIFPGDKTPEGIYDLGGNVWEWTSSLEKEYPYKAGDGREKPETEGKRILRGGAYDTQRKLAHCAQRRPADPTTRAALIGFRVALDAE